MSNSLISVIVVTFNCERWIPLFASSILAQSYSEYEVIIVDNDSKDNTLAVLAETGLSAKIVRLDENMGFGVGNNIGSQYASGDLLFFLNVDTHFDPDFFQVLYNYLCANGLSIVGPRLLGYEGEDQLGERFLSIDVYGGVGSCATPFYIEGSAILIRRLDFELVGRFDSTYFIYGEDVDLSWRIQIAGKRLDVCSNAVLYHYGGGTTTASSFSTRKSYQVPYWRRYQVEKNNLRNIIKNYSINNLVVILPLACVFLLAEAVVYLVLFKNVLCLYSFKCNKVEYAEYN